jgi:dimethylaniline monooxygenase (N-oxide forming)
MSDPASKATGRVCIIGAGSSGLVTAKALLARGVLFDMFEKGSNLGGMWRYENDNGVSSAYRSLHIDTSRKSLQYPDFPIPEDMPDFLSHAQVLAYLEAYAEHFELREHIRFRSEVTQVAPAEGGGWNVTLKDGELRHYRAVIVANGHLWSPRLASFPGRFDGEQMHSHHYRTATPFEDRRVLVVGIGNSAVDIAVDLARQAKSVLLSTRRGAWVMPKYIMGIPTDRWGAFIARHFKLPTPWTRRIVGRLMYLAVGDQARYGVPKPANPIWREHACVSQDLLPYVGHGWIHIKPNVKELRGREVLFDDGTSAPVDTIIHATGYKTSFPFIDTSVFEVKDNEVALYRRMVAAEQPGLYFLGLVQPIGPTIPLVEIQGRWIAGVLAGAVKLPAPAAMQAEIAEHRRKLQTRYVNSARYTLEVDFREHARELLRDLA